ncbi:MULTISPECIES: hypothetical protein [Vibrio harveyi group]|uniref:hypothetical protein n=1 Tax=Vibrio harveyi group TaxID=717610 RepID=UPI0005B6AC7F|nr:hypothetical protein [Vibrio parahaemolyticus]EGQ9584749.1 hypothetical protein [Vibrio parahaemolyticus]EGR2047205.1 hypothetical protein [Vibrio parahaemolyticus]EGR2386724.1 hypothetical protein [Vibrio parahaemolyticus]EGR2596068.1 hypothetical protein [Vibrio parahaemolyticus]EGR3340684.1 hypothetical protein [Vibrio parahaemolyticus]
MARKAPKIDVIKKLCILSKNQCAFPGCDHTILNEKGEYIAQLCHIEAAEKGGERYNENQTDEERRAESNLLFLCHAHHKETDNVTQYTVDVLKEMKRQHESLPEVVFNADLLLQKVQLVLEEQETIREVLEGYTKTGDSNNYPIHGPDFKESWTPEDGRFYESLDSKFKYMMKDGWLHVDVTLDDGAVFYFEVNEKGSVRNSSTPYPINEYHVEIPESSILRKERIEVGNGNYDIKTELKWSKGSVIEHFRYDGVFMGANCNTRCSINHQKRVITVL